MDVVIYILSASILLILILFAVKLRARVETADREHAQNVVARAVARPQAAVEERAAGMPRRRRNLHSRVTAQQRIQQNTPDDEVDPVEADEIEEDRHPSDERPQAAGKVGAKKQRKLEEKQARKAQREAEMEEREERKKMQELRDQERQKEDENERLQEQKQDEELRQAKEEQERREEEEYQRLKEAFVIEEQGESEELTEQESRNLLQEFIDYIKRSKVVLLEDLASHFGMRTQDAIARLQDLMAQGSLTGVIDDRGKFIFITPEELNAVADFIRQRGRVSITELARASNTLINLNPDIQSQ
ncbi:DDRGK domain-containing protein 1-like isoform X1 [Triplophysa dalaica]|uniref:DDRGK domain-containing protein 1-like isoform X1 n=1 Tax=Triplophysa dalaica TaxID=1582913 RepID=UPI0024DF815D|nr:DDRGK domain-containing protein 1-like isoform X1 [Triplophysa dalaica]XP_056603108.1 DDRGK domain-containing protein 1-like isoform X1 [Triplophysa dalaica]